MKVKDETWKAEDAVPKTKPFGKLALLMSSEDSDKVHVGKKNPRTNTTAAAIPKTKPMPPLLFHSITTPPPQMVAERLKKKEISF